MSIPLRQHKFVPDVLSAAAATGLSRIIPVTPYSVITIVIATTGSAAFTLKVKGAIHASGLNNAPTFVEGSASPTNKWTYLQSVNLDDGLKVDGSTGIIYSGIDGVRKYEVNINDSDTLAVDITAYTAGAVYVDLKGVNSV